MRLMTNLTILASSLLLLACAHKGPNPDDPYECTNRKIHKFNMAFDATMLKPPARLYKAMVPAVVRTSVNNFYENINLIPTVANDLLQADMHFALRDSWRLLINTTFGVAGLFDVAEKWGLPPHSNDLGLTFAKWGDKKSPYIVIPLLGPSTIRDGMGMLIEYTVFTPWPYLNNQSLTYGLLALRYVDLRSQLFETERLMDEAIDKYAFIRDAWLQHRNYRISGEPANENEDAGSLYIEEDSPPAPGAQGAVNKKDDKSNK